MGNQQCNACQQLQKSHSTYGPFQLVEEDNCQYAIVSKSIDKPLISLTELNQQLEKRRQIICPNIIVRLRSFQINTDEYFLHLRMKYEFIPITLWDRVQQWKDSDKAPSESQIGNIVLGVEKGLLQLQKIGIMHRSINFNNILCIRSTYKIIDTSMITFLTGVDMAMQGDEQQFLSINMLTFMNNSGCWPIYDYEDDLFSLALLTIAIVLKCNPKQLYSINESGYRTHNLKNIIEGLKIIDSQYDQWIGKKVRIFLGRLLQPQMKSLEKEQIETTCKKQPKY